MMCMYVIVYPCSVLSVTGMSSPAEQQQQHKPLLMGGGGGGGRGGVSRSSRRYSAMNSMSIQQVYHSRNVDIAVLQSAYFIEDAIKYRSIHHKIDPRTLKFYHFYYSRPVQWTVRITIFLVMILAFFEYPSSFSLSSDPRYRNSTRILREQPQCGVTESIEFLCLLIFLLDCLMKFVILGWKRFVRRPWLVVYFVCVVLSFVDLAVSIGFLCNVNSLGYTLRIRRFFRPVYFINASSIMKKFTKAIQRTIPQIASVLFLLLLHIYVFSMVGMLVFPLPSQNSTNATAGPSGSLFAEQEGKSYFPNIGYAAIHLLVTITTANHPDVRMPIYQYNRFSAIYFILFLIIGSYLILNLLIAVVYNQFKGFWVKSMQSSYFRRVVAFRAAFMVLATKTPASRHGIEVVNQELVRRVLQTARIPSSYLPLLYDKFEMLEVENLTWNDFRQVFDVLSKDSKKQALPPNNRRHSPSRAWQWFQIIVRHRYFAYFTYFVSFFNVLLITVELQIKPHDSLRNPGSRLAYYDILFVVYYVIEQVLKILGLGWRLYFKSLGNIYDLVITFCLVVVEFCIIVLYSPPFYTDHQKIVRLDDFEALIRVMNILVVLRLLRVVPHIKSLSFLFWTMFDLIKNLRGFAGIMAVIYYLFALLGMELFLDTVDEKLNDNSSQVNVCGTFENSQYFANNFHDFASSLVVLWDIMVVNNWMVFMFAFFRARGWWIFIYFISWWLVSVVVCLNLFVSIVLDTFMVKWESINKKEQDRASKEGNLRALNASNHWESDTIDNLQVREYIWVLAY